VEIVSEPDECVIILQNHGIIGPGLEGRVNQANVRIERQERWLVEASAALAEAERLTAMLALVRPGQDLMLAALQAQIIVLRREVQWLQRERIAEVRSEFHPDWIEFSAWAPPRAEAP
jgi:hypothetical protein